MSYETSKQKFEELLHKKERKLKKYAESDGATQREVDDQVAEINLMISFLNDSESEVARLSGKEIPAAEPEPEGFWDGELVVNILAFWGLTEKNKKPTELVIQFCSHLKESNRLDHFKEQFANYTAYKKQTGYRHSLKNFLGDPEDEFAEGKWDSENWGVKLAELKTPAKPAEPATVKKETAIERRNRQMRESQSVAS